MKVFISALCLSVALSGAAQRTTKLTASKANDFGVAYSLPLTVFDVVLEAELTESLPGDFANYASLMLNSDNAITDPQYSARVKSVTVVPRGVADEDNRWLIDFKGSGITYVMLDDAGVPVAINTEKYTPAPAPTLPKAKRAEPTALETDAAKQAITQEMTMSSSLHRRAKLASQRIFELRDTRNDLISGNAENTPPDGKSMQLMLDNLSAQEAALNAMFVGTTSTRTDVKTVTYFPGTEDDYGVVIARVSPTKGIVDADDLSGEPVYLDFSILSTGEIPADDNGKPKQAPKDGVAYTIPGSAQISIRFGNRQIASAEYEVAQLGTTFFIDPKIFTDKKNPGYATFNPVTGGLSDIGTAAAAE